MAHAVLLAGGKSRRMGCDKLSLPQNGTTVLEAAVKRFSERFDKVSVSVDDAARYPEISAAKIEDIYKRCGPLGGLHAALVNETDSGVFLAAADLPFSSPEIALKMIEMCTDYEICITADENGQYEPLFGFYSKSVLPTAQELLKSGIYKMTKLYEKHRTLVISPDSFGEVWDSKSFENMNCPEDFDRLLGK